MRSLLNSVHFQAAVIGHWENRPLPPHLAGSRAYTWPLQNVWMGVSVEDQHWADIRIPALLATPAAVRWLSCEPLLGPVDLTMVDWNGSTGLCVLEDAPTGIGWVVTGGESGKGARPLDFDWVRSTRGQCQPAGVPFFHKQQGGLRPKSGGRELDGRTWDEMPVPA